METLSGKDCGILLDYRLSEKPEPDFKDVKIRLLCLVDHEDKERQRYHTEDVHPGSLHNFIDHWEHKYPRSLGWTNHQYIPTSRIFPKNFDDRVFDHLGKAPWFLEHLGYKENTDLHFTYRASAAITNAITSLASSSTWLAGWESAIIDNSTNKDLDILISMMTQVSTAATVTANTIIELNSVSALDDTPTWPDVFDGTASTETITSAGVKSSICLPIAFINVDATTQSRQYYITKRSLAALYNWICPDKSVLFTSQNTGQVLGATAGNHVTTGQGIYLTF